MLSRASSVSEYIESLPPERKKALEELRNVILKNLPEGFSEVMSYGMIGYVVPRTMYPAGYHADPEQPLPFMSIASQKKYIALYHMGIYADPGLMNWFLNEYKKYSRSKIDMGKSCIRFKKIDQIPFKLIGELSGKITPRQWINQYESKIRKL